MQIPSYQIHNVLKNFSQQLTGNIRSEYGPSDTARLDGRLCPKMPLADAEGKRRAVIGKVVDDIVKKITCAKTVDQVVQNVVGKLALRKTSRTLKNFRKDSEFIFNVMNEHGETSTLKRTFSPFSDPEK